MRSLFRSRRPTSSTACRSVAAWFVFAVVLSQAIASAAAGRQQDQAQPEPLALEVGRSVSREVRQQEDHVYRLRLSAGDFVHIVIVDPGTNASMALHAPDEKQVLVNFVPLTPRGERIAYYVVEAAGDYRLVLSLHPDGGAQTYDLLVKERRPATSEDRERAAAMALFSEGLELCSRQTAEPRTRGIEKLSDARARWHALGDRVFEAMTLDEIASSKSYFGLYREAADALTEALAIARELHEEMMETQLLVNIAACQIELGELRRAAEVLEQAIPVCRKNGDKLYEFFATYKLGDSLLIQGDFRRAKALYERASELARERGGDDPTPKILIARVLHKTGDLDAALALFEEALKIARSVDYRPAQFKALSGKGLVYRSLGDFQRALDMAEQALAAARDYGFLGSECGILQQIGDIYADLGETEKAARYYSDSLSIAHENGYVSQGAMALMRLGRVDLDRRQFPAALGHYEAALSSEKQVGIAFEEAVAVRGIGDARAGLGQTEDAVASYERALELFRGQGARQEEAATLYSIGAAFAPGGSARATPYLEKSLELSRSLKDRRLTAAALYQLARLDRDRGELVGARRRIEEAVAIVESLRSSIKSPELRTSFFSTVQGYYELYVDILMRTGAAAGTASHILEALQVNERGRARVLLESLAERGVDLREGVDPRLYSQEQEARRQLIGKLDYQVRLLSRDHPPEEAEALQKEIGAQESRLETIQADIRKVSPAYAALTQPEPITVEAIQAGLLDAGTALVEYALGDERSYVWAVTKTGVVSAELPARAEIEARARRVRELLVARACEPKHETDDERAARVAAADAAYAKESAELSRMVLAPVAKAIAGKRVAVVADGALQLVPFAALPEPSGRGYLVERHEVVVLPSATALGALRRQTEGRAPAALGLAVLADPVFAISDPRVAGAKAAPKPEATGAVARVREAVRSVGGGCEERTGLERLEGSRREADAIARLVPEGQRLEAVDFAANLELATGGELGRYQVVHFATHGYVPADAPELAGLVLSLVDAQGREREGYLGLPQIYNLRLPAEVVVLSACETGLGKQVRGEGLVGLVRGFMYAGARRVVASLWKVDDRETSALMAAFYREMLVGKQAPSAALRAAQLRMVRQDRAPYVWAAFQLSGEWR